eukprot:Gb_21138 [translate_table: standard]
MYNCVNGAAVYALIRILTVRDSFMVLFLCDIQGLMPQMVGMRSSFPGAVPLLQSGRQTTATIAVPDEHVGAIVGRGGRVITEIQQASGANIKISDRGDFLSGTNDRKVTITGSAECIRVAKRMLKQKVEQSVSSEFER